ncbi:flagellar hook assembly protein FlgD [Jatrophihabitans sp.]|uniref:flagellar hook assembly protein FlgD n=1 Tax=Jatrophihabitans sp. TaxID=1932789 RepID=UPI002C419DAD|nr:flagellar hook capping FlgD N-terminal domain-containing protein [Jatrophihabitans sp.]
MTLPVSAVASGQPVLPNPAIDTTDNAKLSSKAFLQLLVAQLRYQDPSKPVDTSAFMNETATLTQVQSSEQTAQVSLDMLTAQRAQTASSLVGHTVSYTAADGSQITGYVSSATISSAKPTLRIGTVDVDLSQVQQVLASGTP